MVYSAFSYKQGNSFFHRCPAWIKILLVPIVSLIVFQLPMVFVLGVITLLTLVSCILKFTMRDFLGDLKPVLYYAAFLFFTKLTGKIASVVFEGNFYWPGFLQFVRLLKDFLISEKQTWILLLKLLCVMQTASLVFKTSTRLQIREGLEKLELTVRRIFHLNKITPVADILAVFVCFIPQVSKNWQQTKLAWCARGGKSGLRMLIVLLPVFFSVGMKQAYNSARAISVRH